MVRNDSATDGQPEAGSLPGWFSREEGFEDATFGPLGDSGSIVGDPNSGCSWRVIESNVDPAAGFGDGVGGVLEDTGVSALPAHPELSKTTKTRIGCVSMSPLSKREFWEACDQGRKGFCQLDTCEVSP